MSRRALMVACVMSVLSLSLGLGSTMLTARGADAAAPAKKDKPKRGPLPSYYADVVDGVQRDKIYAIQDRYKPEIDDLRAKLKTALEKRDAEIGTLLNDEQKAKVAKLRQEAEAKAQAKAAESKKKPAKDQAAPTAEASAAATSTTAAPSGN